MVLRALDPAHGVTDGPRPGRRRGVFVDLAIAMVVLGVAIGALFPLAIIPLQVPAAVALRPAFFAATLTAGVLLGTLNFVIAHRVVGSRLRLMAERMRYVGDVIKEATFTGDWSNCDPATCELPDDADDAIGTAAAAFNRLMYALRDSRAVEDALAQFTSGLSQHLTSGNLADVMVQRLVACVGGTGGALLVREEQTFRVAATTGVPAPVLDDPDVRRALHGSSSVALVWEGQGATDTVAGVLVTPLRQSDTVGALVACLPVAPPPTVVRLAEMMRGTAAVALDNAAAHQRVRALASRDALTGLANRRAGRAQLDHAWAVARGSGRPLGVLMIDLDHFKAINDTHGHDTGDRVLQAVATALGDVLRGGDLVFRSGGEEFVAVLPGSDHRATGAVAERVRRCVADVRIATADGTPVAFTTSVGGVSIPETDCASAEQMLRVADLALYDAKARGRDRVSLHPPGRPAAAPEPSVVSG